MSKGTVLASHTSASYAQQLGKEFESMGYAVKLARSCKELRAALALRPPDLLVSELRLVDGPTFALLEHLREISPDSRIVVVTDHGSIASALRCTRLGVAGYYTQRVSASQLITLKMDDVSRVDRPGRPIRLDRAVWEYLNRVVDCTGSIAGAADVLGLDRRSLRRMLSKAAPPL